MLLAIITYGANSLNADWSMKSVFFFLNFALRKGQNHSLTIGPLGCLTTAYSIYSIEKLFFCNNGVSFRDS